MFLGIRGLALVVAMVAVQAGYVDAATLSVVGGKADVLDSDFNPDHAGGAAIGDPITAFTGLRGWIGGGLWVDAKAVVTYTYIGTEAGARNRFIDMTSGAYFDNKKTGTGAAMTVAMSGAGYLPFKFQTSGLKAPSDPGILNDAGRKGGKSAYAPLGLAFSAIRNHGQSVLAFFDDGRAVDSDYDDMIVRISIAAVPLPAGGALLVTGLGSLAALRRRRRA